MSNIVQASLEERRVKVFFVSGKVTKWYNAQRVDRATEVALLGGWYWTLGDREGGPFRTASGAQRDAYYRMVRQIQPPLLTDTDVRRAQREIAKPAPAPRVARSAHRVA